MFSRSHWSRLTASLLALLLGSWVWTYAVAADAPGKLTISVPSGTVLPYHGFLFLGVPLGFYKELGLPNVDIVSIDGSSAALQLLASGDAQVGHVGLSAFLAAKANQPDLPVTAVFLQDIKGIYSIGVPQDSAIHEVSDLKGKRIGVLDFASGAVPWVKDFLQAHGVGEKDVEILPVGAGAQAAAALRGHLVDAVSLSTGLSASVESLGFPMRYFTKDEPSGIIAANSKFLAQHRNMVIEALKGIVLNQTFMEINPEASVREYWKMYGRPKGPSEAQAMTQGKLYVVRLSEIWKDYRDTKRRWGDMNDATWTDLAQFKPIKDKLGSDEKVKAFLKDLYTNDLIKDVNTVDLSPAIKAAKAGE